jgi:hypothetical protein
VEDAEDTMQQTLLKACEELPQLQFTDEKALRVKSRTVGERQGMEISNDQRCEPHD